MSLKTQTERGKKYTQDKYKTKKSSVELCENLGVSKDNISKTGRGGFAGSYAEHESDMESKRMCIYKHWKVCEKRLWK